MDTSSKGTLLLVDDDQSLGESFSDIFTAKGYDVTFVEDGDYALDLIEEQEFDAVVTDFEMPVLSGMELLDKTRKLRPRLPVIIMTGHSSTKRAIEATKHGAFDYLIKPVEVPDLLDAVAKAIASHRLTAKPIALGKAETDDPNLDTIIGSSKEMVTVFKDIGRIASKQVPVLVSGETGSGKEVVARALWQFSDRAGKPFVAVNCAAIPENLIESELFGHERGAFTNAVAQRIGRFEQAKGGTVFLDEIGDLPKETQVKLLRVLQERVITRVGGQAEIPIDVRVISASHRDIRGMIEDKSFREDLFYRLNAAEIALPPLRDRLSDIPELSNYFLARYANEFQMAAPSLHSDARKKLTEYHWPGNVRELSNVLRKALVSADGRTISSENIAEAIASISGAKNGDQKTVSDPTSSSDLIAEIVRQAIEAASIDEAENEGGAYPKLVQQIEEEMFRQAVLFTHGNQSRMARLLGFSRITIREKLDRYDLFPNRGKS